MSTADVLKGIELNQIVEFDLTVLMFLQKFPGKGTGFYSKHDWNRIKKCYELISGKTILDIGIGNGALLNILSKSKKFKKITGIDIRRHSMLVLPEDVEHHIMNITQLSFKKDEFETIVAMEVIEHLEYDEMVIALKSMREIAKNRIIISLPYNEPHPVWRHDRPGGHRQSFDDDKLAKLFPTAHFFIKKRGGALPWVFVIEDKNHKAEQFKLESFDKIKNLLS